MGTASRGGGSMRQNGGVAGLQEVEAEDCRAHPGTSENWLQAMLRRGNELSKCPRTHGWLKKMWQTSTMEHSSAVRRDEMLPLATIDLNSIGPSES